MKSLVVLAMLMPTTLGASGLVQRQPSSIYLQIVKNKPNINKTYAVELAYVIEKIANSYEIKASKLTAILAQESMYNLKTLRCRRGVCTDFGIAQIHYKTVKSYGFDKHMLVTNLEYSVEAGAKVLADFKKMYGHKEPDYWTRYNTSNPIKREKYKKLVMRYM